MNARIFAPLAVALALAGCASFDGIAPTARSLQAADLGAGGAAMEWPAADWWSVFADPELGRLIERALADNPGLKIAQARVVRAQAAAGSAESALYPQLNADASLQRQRYSEHADVPPPIAGSVQEFGRARLTAGWEIDFFGRNRAALDAALGSAQAAAADAQAARVLLASEVARRYFGLARLIEQRDNALDTLKQRRAILKLVDERVQAGLDTKVEYEQAAGAVPEIERDLAGLDEQIALARHGLAALLGAGPQAADAISPRLAQVRAPDLPASLPADLVGRRADLTAARLRVQAALRQVDAAKAEFYPNVNLLAFVGFSAFGLANWFDSGSREAGVGAAIHLPIFDAGRLRANLRGKSADADAAVETYNATLVEALRQVADPVATLAALERQQAQQAQALSAAQNALDLALQRYRAGLGGYLSVLAAETNVLAQRRTSTDLKARGLDARVQLIHALGGGYSAAA